MYWECNTCGSYWRAKTPPNDDVCPGCNQTSTFKNVGMYKEQKERAIKIMEIFDGIFNLLDMDNFAAPLNEKKLANVFDCDVSFLPIPAPEGATYEEKQAMRVYYHITITYSNNQCSNIGGEVKEIKIDFLPDGAPKLSDISQSDAEELAKIAFASSSAPTPIGASAPKQSGMKSSKKPVSKSSRSSVRKSSKKPSRKPVKKSVKKSRVRRRR